MPQLKAFVGHSFAKEDEVVVRELTKLLDSIAKVMPEFSWDHAEAAEPKELSVKVREKMKGKNLFIGICTAREHVVRAAETRALFARWFLPKTQLAVEKSSIEIKTTDWVIQEIGYALGSGEMDLIILLENGVRRPGGLQGDIEHIPFSRNEPAKCFDKLSSMLSSLSPKPMPAVESEQPAASESSAAPAADLFFQQFFTPEPDWNAETYVDRYRSSIMFKEDESQQRIAAAFESSPFYKEEAARVSFEAAGISQRARSYKEDWLEPLRKLVSAHPAQVGPYSALGERFAAAHEYEQAAENYELAAIVSPQPLEKIQFLITAATQRVSAKQPVVAETLLKAAAGSLRANPEHEAEALGQMSYVWKDLGKTDLFIACAERCLELAPDKTNPRFALAHKYSELHLNAEALYHYRQYVLAKDDPGGWNNLGVAAANSKLPVTAVDCYLRADKAGSTLATSNLAFAKLEAGFTDEAIELCNNRTEAKDIDPRLFDALAKSNRAREDEATKESELLGEIVVRREVFRAMGKASLRSTPSSLRPTWQGSNCRLVAEFDGSRVAMNGTYERQSGSMTGFLGGLFSATNSTEIVTVEYTGEMFGEAFVGKVKTSTPSTPAVGLLSLGGGQGSDCVGYIESNGAQFVMLDGKNRYILEAI
jgi:tetratricopeptide (TPR) repeat protein